MIWGEKPHYFWTHQKIKVQLRTTAISNNHQTWRSERRGFFFPGCGSMCGTGAELGGSNSHIFMFIPILPGEMIQFDYSNIFQMGWFKHQPENNADSTETTREMNSDVSDRDLIHEC